MLRYQGAIDDKPTAAQADIAGARNRVTAALSELKVGKSVSDTEAFGCEVKCATEPASIRVRPTK